jgi:hypothetical protein
MRVGKTPWKGDQAVARPLPTQDIINTEQTHASSGTRTHDTSVPGAKEFRDPDRAATLINITANYYYKTLLCKMHIRPYFALIVTEYPEAPYNYISEDLLSLVYNYQCEPSSHTKIRCGYNTCIISCATLH